MTNIISKLLTDSQARSTENAAKIAFSDAAMDPWATAA